MQQLNRDPAKGQGPSTIKNHIAHDQGIQLTRDDISSIMHTHDPDAFLAREPGAKRIHRVPKAPIGVHERWSGDGHDKLYKIGFPIWAIVDDATARWLAAWVVPSNRMGDIIGYLFLCLVIKYKGTWFFSASSIAAEFWFRAPAPIYYRLRLRDDPTLWTRECSLVRISVNDSDIPF